MNIVHSEIFHQPWILRSIDDDNIAAVSQAKGEKNRRQMHPSLLWLPVSSFVCNLSTRWKRKERKLCQFSAWWWKKMRCSAVEEKKITFSYFPLFPLARCSDALCLCRSIHSRLSSIFYFILMWIEDYTSLVTTLRANDIVHLFSVQPRTTHQMWWIAADVLFDLGDLD